MPYFSIIIPLYNKEKYLQKTLESVLNQTFSNFEVVIVNDGSTDGSETVIHKFSDTRIKYYKTANNGVSQARNYGVEKANGSLIALLDADDYWKNDHLEKLYALVQEYPNCGMYCSRYVTKISKKNYLENSFKEVISKEYRGIIKDFFLTSVINRVATCSSVAFSKKIFEEFNGFNTKISNGEDTELWIKIGYNYPVAITNKVTAVYQFDIPNTLSKKSISDRKLFDIDQFASQEIDNPSLKRFLDIYRIEYALHYRTEGNYTESNKLISKLKSNDLPIKTQILLKTPAFILQNLLALKRFLKKIGIDFTVYH